MVVDCGRRAFGRVALKSSTLWWPTGTTTGWCSGFQVKFLIEDRKIDPFNRHGVETHRRYAQQEIADVEIHLLCHPLIVIFQLFAVHIGKESATLVVSGFASGVAKRPSASS